MAKEATTHHADTAVLIVGAGPTGLALACDLARRGIHFRIIDKAPAYFAGSRGKGLQPRTLEVLDDLGVIDEILANGRFHLPFRGYDGATVLGDYDMHEGRHPTPDVPYASTLIIPQFRVEEILRRKLAQSAVTVELSSELTGLDQNEENVTAHVTNSDGIKTITAHYLVAADGGKSFVRKHLDIPFAGETWADERLLLGDVQATALDRDHWHSWRNHPAGWVALCPLPSTNSFQFQAQIPPDYAEEPSLERFQQIVDERTKRTDIKLSNATWLSLFRANVRMIDRYRVGRVFLAGDAAHVHSPAGGQGMNTGIQDAYNLGWKMAAVLLNGGPDSLLDTYEEERLPVAAWLLGITSHLHRHMLTDAAKPRDPQFLQLALNYRDSSLAQASAAEATSLEAGDRAPDSLLQDGNGKPIRLFDVLRGPKFTLLCFGGADDALRSLARNLRVDVWTIAKAGTAAPGPATLIDKDGYAATSYGVENNAVFLVRPDGYLGYVHRGSEPRTVQEDLTSFFRKVSAETAVATG